MKYKNVHSNFVKNVACAYILGFLGFLSFFASYQGVAMVQDEEETIVHSNILRMRNPNISYDETASLDEALLDARKSGDNFQIGNILTKLSKIHLNGDSHFDSNIARQAAFNYLKEAAHLGNEEARLLLEKEFPPSQGINSANPNQSKLHSNIERSSEKEEETTDNPTKHADRDESDQEWVFTESTPHNSFLEESFPLPSEGMEQPQQNTHDNDRTPNVNTSTDKINYKNLETLVRFKVGEGQNANYFKDYTGIDVMFETRDKGTKEYAWAAKVSFRPRKSEASPWFIQDSKVVIHYLFSENYIAEDRNYGTLKKFGERSESSIPDKKGNIIKDTTYPLNIFHCQLEETDGKGKKTNNHKRWIETSIYEWSLEKDVYTFQDLHKLVKSLKNDKQEDSFPRYYLFGYTSDGGCLNCVTFSSILLEKVGVPLSKVSPMIASYIEDDAYKNPTRWGRVASGIRKARAGLGIGGGALIGGEIGSVGGPPGVVVGAVVGGIVLGSASYLESSVIKAPIDWMVNFKNAVTPERFVREIYVNRRMFEKLIVKLRFVRAFKPKAKGGITGSSQDVVPNNLPDMLYMTKSIGASIRTAWKSWRDTSYNEPKYEDLNKPNIDAEIWKIFFADYFKE